MSNDKLRAELEALRAKRKPAMTDAERKAKEEEAALLAELEAERRALREEENEDIKSKHAPNKTREFFDFDPDGEQPTTIEHNGVTCALYTRVVACGANADQLERIGDAITAKPGKDGEVSVDVDTAKITAVTNEIAEQCIAWPTAKELGISDEQHRKNIKASLNYLGAARAAVGAAARRIGEAAAKAHASKS